MRFNREGDDGGGHGNTPVDEDMLGPEHGEPIRGLSFLGHVDLAVRILGLGLALTYTASLLADIEIDKYFPLNQKEINVLCFGYGLPIWMYLTYRFFSTLTPEERKLLAEMYLGRKS